jgi:hypothetical protein
LCSLEREESVRNTSGESLPLYKIKGGSFEGKIEASKTSVCVRRYRSGFQKGVDLDWILERLRSGREKGSEKSA